VEAGWLHGVGHGKPGAGSIHKKKDVEHGSKATMLASFAREQGKRKRAWQGKQERTHGKMERKKEEEREEFLVEDLDPDLVRVWWD
jgi:hypothetical protein